MDAHVYPSGGDWFVSLRFAGSEIDNAGPFDDENDAVMMAERSVFSGGRVFVTSNTPVSVVELAA